MNCPIIYTLNLITRQFCCGQILLSVIKPHLPSSWQSGGYLETAFKEVIEATLRGTWTINAVELNRWRGIGSVVVVSAHPVMLVVVPVEHLSL